MKYTALLLDDEEKGRTGLEKLITDYCPNIELVGTCSNGEDAYAVANKLRPQILFFDIEIGQASSEYATSFEILSKLPQYNYEVIFVSAYEHYALQALRSHAIGYILKPVAITDLTSAVADAVSNLQSAIPESRTLDMVAQVRTNVEYGSKIWIHSYKDIIPINVVDIIRLEAQGKYTDIHCAQSVKITSSKNLGEFTDILDSEKFIKIHRSHMVNVDQITKFSKTDGGYVVVSDGSTVPVSRSGKEKLLANF
jgi:two-component system LytT family response regulator